jgi:hypothetical protein
MKIDHYDEVLVGCIDCNRNFVRTAGSGGESQSCRDFPPPYHLRLSPVRQQMLGETSVCPMHAG